MALNYSLSKLLARQNARQMSREQALAELQAEQARIGQVTGALGALTQAGLAAGGAAQQIGQQAGEADALALLAQQAKPKPQPVSPADELPKPVGDKPPEPVPVAKAEEPKPEDDAELKALLEKQRAGMSAAIDPLGKQPEPVGVPAGGVAAAGKDIASMARQATPEEKPKEEKGYAEQVADFGKKVVDNIGGAAAATALGAAGVVGGPAAIVATDLAGNEGKATRQMLGTARDIVTQGALPDKAQERQGRASGYQSRVDDSAAMPERPALPPPRGRPRLGEEGAPSKNPPPSPPKWETTPAQEAARILEKAKTNTTWQNILSLGGYGRGQRDGLIKAIEDQRAQETAQFDQALKVYQSTGKFDMGPAKTAPRGTREDGRAILNTLDGIKALKAAAALPEARFRTEAEIRRENPNWDPKTGEVSLEQMALNQKYQRMEAESAGGDIGGLSVLSEADKQAMKDFRDLNIDSRLKPQQRAMVQKYATLRNEILRANAGTAQTLSEAQNTLDEMGNPFKYGFNVSLPVMQELMEKRAKTFIQSEFDYSTTAPGIEEELFNRIADGPYRLEYDGVRYVEAPDAPPPFTPELAKKVGAEVPAESKADEPKKAEKPKAKPAPKLSEALKKPTAAKPAVSPLRAQLDAAVAASRADPGDPAKRAAVRALLAQMRAAQ